MLPNDLQKLMDLALLKHFKDGNEVSIYNMKEISAIKCIIDFRIEYYNFIGKKNYLNYLEAAIDLHRRLTKKTVSMMNEQLDKWIINMDGHPLIVYRKSRKNYVDHY